MYKSGVGDAATILIVDDHLPNLMAMEAVLAPLQQRLLRATSGAEALKILLNEDCALILLDVQMPGLDGFETASLIHGRERSKYTPIIFVTAVQREEAQIVKGYAQGAVDYIVKPFDRAMLIAKVRVFLAQHQREEALRRREAEALALAEERRGQLHALFMQAPAAIAILRGPAAIFELANGRFEDLVGARSLVGKKCEDALGKIAPEVCKLVTSAQSSGKTIFAAEHALGARFFNVVVQPTDWGTLFHAAETTEAVRARSKLEESDRRKDEFLAMLSHELRNPLAPIVTALQLMKMRESGADLVEERTVIERQVGQLSRLVDDLLDVSRATLGKIRLRREHLELAQAVTRAVEAVSPTVKSRRHTLTVQVPARGLAVEADPIRLTQVVGNLLHNAAKYTPPGGKIEVIGERDNDEVVLRVRDNGIGIAPEHLASMFELFVQGEQSLDRAQGGLGVGLTLVRSLVELHGGSVHGQSDGPGRGTEFTVRLPSPRGSAAPDAPGQAPRRAHEPRRVLVVDDNRDAAATLLQALVLTGNEVRQEHDGEAALKAVAEFAPEVILLDLGLPGMDGFEVARKVRAAHPAIRLVALTGYADESARAAEAGFERFLVKPVDLQAVLDAIAA